MSERVDIFRVLVIAGLEKSTAEKLEKASESSKRISNLAEKWFFEESQEECEKIMNSLREKATEL